MLETLFNADNEAKLEEDEITLMVAPVVPVAIAELDADSEGCDAVAISDTADEAENNEVTDVEGVAAEEAEGKVDLEGSSVDAGDGVDITDGETLVVILTDAVGSGVNDKVAALDNDKRLEMDASADTDESMPVPLAEALS